jgi:uncharacterized protein
MERNQLTWINEKLETRNTVNYGKGIFCVEPVIKGEILATFGGHVMTIEQESLLEGNLSDYSLQISDDLVIGPAFEDEISAGEYFNHSCKPNAGFNGQIVLVAMRDIQKDEQISFDYAMVIAGPVPYEMSCECGEDICRNKITNLDWQLTELQSKYRGYFQPYIQNKINKN